MAGPFKPIPETTQAHVDRVVGSQVGDHRVVRHVAEGRFGTIYRCEQVDSGKPATLQVLRTQVVGKDAEVRAANALKTPGVATVSAFGELPDGRRWRLIELLDGESLDQVLERKRGLPTAEAVELLDQIAAVLEATHAWAVVHGSLVSSSVFLTPAGVKLIDFGLAREPATAQTDLKALGLLGFALLTGKEVGDGVPPPLRDPKLEPIDRVLRELVEARMKDATAARKAFAELKSPFARPPSGSRRPIVFALAGVGLVAALALALVLSMPKGAVEPEAQPLTDEQEATILEESGDGPNEPEEPEPAVAASESRPDAGPVAPRPVRTPRRVKPPPSAEELQRVISSLELRLRRQARPGDDLAQALHVLSKQRLRLVGSPSVQERKDVARQLAGWRRSYLR